MLTIIDSHFYRIAGEFFWTRAPNFPLQPFLRKSTELLACCFWRDSIAVASWRRLQNIRNTTNFMLIGGLHYSWQRRTQSDLSISYRTMENNVILTIDPSMDGNNSEVSNLSVAMMPQCGRLNEPKKSKHISTCILNVKTINCIQDKRFNWNFTKNR